MDGNSHNSQKRLLRKPGKGGKDFWTRPIKNFLSTFVSDVQELSLFTRGASISILSTLQLILTEVKCVKIASTLKKHRKLV